MQDKLTSKVYWDTSKRDFTPYSVSAAGFSTILEKFLPHNQKMSSVKIGVYPGRYLWDMAKRFRYPVTALEYSDRANDIALQLDDNGVEDYVLENVDFLEYESKEKFDVVTSFG